MATSAEILNSGGDLLNHSNLHLFVPNSHKSSEFWRRLHSHNVNHHLDWTFLELSGNIFWWVTVFFYSFNHRKTPANWLICKISKLWQKKNGIALFLQAFFFVLLGQDVEEAKRRFRKFAIFLGALEVVLFLVQATTAYGRVATNANITWVSVFMVEEALHSLIVSIMFIVVGIYFGFVLTRNIEASKFEASKKSLRVARIVIL